MSSYEKVSTINSSERLDVVITIVSRGKGETVVDLARENGVINNLLSQGRGTAPSSILEMLGLGATEKDIIFSSSHESGSCKSVVPNNKMKAQKL